MKDKIQLAKVFSLDALPIVPSRPLLALDPTVLKWADDLTEFLRKLRGRISQSQEIQSTEISGETRVFRVHYKGDDSPASFLVLDTDDYRKYDFATWLRGNFTLADLPLGTAEVEVGTNLVVGSIFGDQLFNFVSLDVSGTITVNAYINGDPPGNGRLELEVVNVLGSSQDFWIELVIFITRNTKVAGNFTSFGNGA